MSQTEDTIDLKRVVISIFRFIILRRNLLVFGFIIFCVLGAFIRFSTPKEKKNSYEINYLLESTIVPKETLLGILESIGKYKEESKSNYIQQSSAIKACINYSLLELSIQGNEIEGIEKCYSDILRTIESNAYIQFNLLNLNDLLGRIESNIQLIERVKLSPNEINNPLEEKLFYQSQSKNLIDLYKEKQRIETSIENKSGIQLVSKSSPKLVKKYSFIKEIIICSGIGFLGVFILLLVSLGVIFIRKMKNLEYQ